MTVAIVRFALVSALAAGAVGSTTFPGAAAGASTSQSFVAAADAYVSSASPSTNFGSDTGLVVDGAPLGGNARVAHAYLRFDVEGLDAPVTSARLSLFALAGDKGGFDVSGVPDTSWLEDEITWNNAPAPAPAVVDSSGGFVAGSWVSVDVTPLVSWDGPVAVQLRSSATWSPMELASRENGVSRAPRLIVETTAVPPSNETAPTVSGTPAIGTTLTASTGTWSGTEPMTFAYQWRLCDASGAGCIDIPGATASTFGVDAADVGSTLQVAVTASNAGGSSTATSAPTDVVPSPADTTPPSDPADLTVTGATTTTISLSWSPSTDDVGVAGYDVYVDGSNVDTTTQTSYDFGGLNCGTAYTLGVVAFDAAGNRSGQSTQSASTAACPPPPPPPGPCGTASTPPATYQHVVWIVFENHSYSQIIGSSSAPYINQLASDCGLATNFHAETHPSLPNYIAMTSGSTQGITDDNGPGSHPLDVPSIFSQLPGGGSRSLQESMPSNCLRSNSGQYAVRHNPEAYYTNLGTDCANFDVPLASPPNISAGFTFVTPNLCNDMHDCSVATGDAWLSNFLPTILSS